MNPRKPKVAIYKFASCDGCQLSLLDAEDELLAVAGAIDLSYFPEASRKIMRGPYDLGVVRERTTRTMWSASVPSEKNAARSSLSAHAQRQGVFRRCATGKM